MELKDIEPTLIVYTSPDSEKKFRYETSRDTWTRFFTKKQHKRPIERIHFIVHGFRTDDQALWMMEMKDALFQESPHKIVVIVGWEEGAYYEGVVLYYRKAIVNMEKVGKWLGPYVKALKEAFPDIYIHGIGHSLGAHLLGYAGQASRKAFNRITGLDPAGPNFEGLQPEKILDKSDADGMVDIIHTDGFLKGLHWWDPIALFGYVTSTDHFGTLVPSGSIDFYPNFGIAPQPGASRRHVNNAIRNSHSRAYLLFTWSILNRGAFKTRQVLSKPPTIDNPVETTATSDEVEMGYFADTYKGATGHYYIKTTSGAPWVQGRTWFSRLNPFAYFKRQNNM